MIIKEFYRTTESGIKLYKTYSDNRLYIRKIGTNEIYVEAVDVENSDFQYTETDEVIPEVFEDDLV